MVPNTELLADIRSLLDLNCYRLLRSVIKETYDVVLEMSDLAERLRLPVLTWAARNSSLGNALVRDTILS